MLEAKPIWGANDPPGTVKHSFVDPDLAATLRRHFKWTNYFEITNLTAVIPLNQGRAVRMSDHCTLNIKNLGSCSWRWTALARANKSAKAPIPCPAFMPARTRTTPPGSFAFARWTTKPGRDEGEISMPCIPRQPDDEPA